MQLRYVSISPVTETVADECPTCRASLLAPGALRCRMLVDVERDQVTHQDGHPDELELANMSGNYFGDLREPLEWRCGSCDAVICPTRPSSAWSRLIAAISNTVGC